MRIFSSLVRKETLQIVRDRRTMLITVFMPVVLLLLFGFAISTEVNSVRIATVVGHHTEQTREIIERITVNDYFSFIGQTSEEESEYLLKTGNADAILFMNDDQGVLKAQAVVDASNTSSAQAIVGYVEGVLESGQNRATPVLLYTLYNPQFRSSYNIVPGSLGMIFILICSIMTSVSIVREKETGT
ncbi:MAG: ABC transporter permease, partial [Duncaniella sp.]|nr:ABC transporter permease [Duncaniella sp.]